MATTSMTSMPTRAIKKTAAMMMRSHLSISGIGAFAHELEKTALRSLFGRLLIQEDESSIVEDLEEFIPREGLGFSGAGTEGDAEDPAAFVARSRHYRGRAAAGVHPRANDIVVLGALFVECHLFSAF